jgi:hypothetical protein
MAKIIQTEASACLVVCMYVGMWTKPIVKNGLASSALPEIPAKTAENSCFGAPGRQVREAPKWPKSQKLKHRHIV